MSSDAEDRASALLLPGQELEAVQEEGPTVDYSAYASDPFGPLSSGTAPQWTPSLPSSWDFAWEQPREQIQSFSMPLAPINFFLNNNVEPGSMELAVYDDFTSCHVPEATQITATLTKFESVTFEAEMDFVTGCLTIMRTDMPIQQLQVRYRMKNVPTMFDVL